MLGGFVSFKIWTHLLLNSCVVHAMVWSLLEVELCMVSSPRKLSILRRHLKVGHTLQVWPHVSQNISGACIVLVSKMQTNPGIDFSGASDGEFAIFPTISQTLAAEALAISMEAPTGNARDAAEERRLQRKG